MQHWLQLATRNWRAKLVRTLGAVLAVMIGTAAVVWVTSSYESVRRTVLGWAAGYVGLSHITVQSPLGKYDSIPQRLVEVVAGVEGVRTVNGRLIQRLHAQTVTRAERERLPGGVPLRTPATNEVDFQGIVPETEYLVHDHQRDLVAGRLLDESSAGQPECVLDSDFAAECGIGLGDLLFVWGASETPVALEVVGLIERKRIARFQKALALVPLQTLQQINSKHALITSIDLVLHDSSADSLTRAASEVRTAVRSVSPSATVRSVAGRMQQIEAAQRQQRVVLMLMSCIVMLTALVTILSTLSMGLIERIGELGLMRCVGLTGGQLAWLVLWEVLPLGALGVLAGLPLGLLMAAGTVWFVPQYVGSFAVSGSGLVLAVVAGLATTLVAALLPMLAALSVSPMEAARPRARQASRWILAVVLAVAGGLLALQHVYVMPQLQRSATFFEGASVAVVLLYAGYALLAAPLVWLLGRPAVALAASVLRVRARLLQEQVGHALWRSAGICCGLMVALSLIIELAVVNASIVGGWQFPRQFPEAYVWSFEEMRPDAVEVARQTPGVGSLTVASATNAIVRERRPLFMEEVLRSVTWLMGCDPDTFFDMVRVEIVDGDLREAIALLKQGGHVVVADDFARSRNKGRGDEVTVFVGDRAQRYRIAAVMRSPALDIAAGYFQAHSEFSVVASGSVMATSADLRRHFDIRGTRMLLLNFDLPPEPVPSGWPPAPGTREAAWLGERARDASLPVEKRWRAHREEQVLEELRRRLNAPQAYVGTARELKDAIDAELQDMTRLLSAVPGLALIVAALGVANLMSANVASRSRQIAILRAVGATRGLVLRLVVGESLVLGGLGSALGLGLGLHLAHNIVEMLDRMWGFRVDVVLPWPTIIAAMALAVGLCVLAGVLPARHAARTNVVDALRVS